MMLLKQKKKSLKKTIQKFLNDTDPERNSNKEQEEKTKKLKIKKVEKNFSMK